MATATPAPTVTVEDVLRLCRDLAAARAKRQINAEHCAITMLIGAINALPEWVLPPIVEPAAEVERKLACGAKLVLRNEDGCVVLVVSDEETTMAPAITADEATRLRADLARVLAAGKDSK